MIGVDKTGTYPVLYLGAHLTSFTIINNVISNNAYRGMNFNGHCFQTTFMNNKVGTGYHRDKTNGKCLANEE